VIHEFGLDGQRGSLKDIRENYQFVGNHCDDQNHADLVKRARQRDIETQGQRSRANVQDDDFVMPTVSSLMLRAITVSQVYDIWGDPTQKTLGNPDYYRGSYTDQIDFETEMIAGEPVTFADLVKTPLSGRIFQCLATSCTGKTLWLSDRP
jgi:hypothetical protein